MTTPEHEMLFYDTAKKGRRSGFDAVKTVLR